MCTGVGAGQRGSGKGSEGSGEVWEALVQSEIRFNRVPEKVPKKVLKKVLGSLGAKPSEVQQGSGEGSGEGSGNSQEGFGAEPGQVQQGFGESSGEGLGGFGRSGSTGFRRRFRRRVSEKVPEKVWEALAGQVQQGSGEGSGKVPEKIPEKVGPVGEALGLWCTAEVFPALGFPVRFRKIVKIKRCGCWGYRQSFFDIDIFIHRNMFSILSKNISYNKILDPYTDCVLMGRS